ncbi:helix-turn-helix domain-containing protein [Salinimonas profundi]|uniref:helix-turn-helix domain-containing protein n=1 Tax=Salinimonas profundi TaxID=2729140 RepID=UPI00295E3C3A|nr:XRE family transcriptional regulator [Salinimonas profundi]
MKESAHITQQIAAQLKYTRKQKGWSLDKTAQATGVSKAMLGQIEREESSPTIATLWKIATGLDASFSSFISSQTSDAYVLSQQRQAAFTHDPDMQVTTLFKFNPVTRMETFEITLTNHHEQRSSAHASGVTEHIHVLKGELAVYQQDVWHTVKANEQFILQADTAHGYRDETGETTFIDIICYP